MKKTKLLIILDGWGHSTKQENNAIAMAKKPIWDMLIKNYPNTLIDASGSNVGLPNGQMGNSEVGHLTIGSGRIIKQNYTIIQKNINSGKFHHNKELSTALDKTKNNSGAVHIIGQLSDGGVHSHHGHILAMLESAHLKTSKEIYIHIFTDGRDTPPNSAQTFITDLENKIQELGSGKIASIVGRFYAMDRDKRWDRIKKAYELIMQGDADFKANNANDAIEQAYIRGETDEFIKPTIIGDGVSIKDGDAVIFMNYRADRARQLTQAITDKEFCQFKRRNFVSTNFVCLTEYKKEFNLPCAFPPQIIKNTLGECIANAKMTQLKIAETEKYAHVTFFFNGGVEKELPGEDRKLINSPKVATYDLKPEMSAPELTNSLVKFIKSCKYDLIICNYANADMVGHSGNLKATILAIEAIDSCLGAIVDACNKVEAEILITADHGNAEQMLDLKTKRMHTAHTNNFVPLIYVGNRDIELLDPEVGSLAGLAPSLLKLMNVEKPEEMTGKCLIKIN